MKKSIFFVVATFILILLSCQQNASNGSSAGQNSTGSTRDTVSVVNFTKSPQADTLYVDLKILDPQGKKVFYDKLDKGDFTVRENGSDDLSHVPIVDSVIDIRQKRVISDQISILFLVDRSGSITQEALNKQFYQIADILGILPDTKVYISFMDSTVTTSQLATKDNLNYNFYEEFKVRNGTQKYLYKAIMSKMEELSGASANHYPEVVHCPDFGDSTQKILFVLTDGKVKNADGSFIGGASFSDWKDEIIGLSIKQESSEAPYIPIHCIYIGDPKTTGSVSDEMEALCSTTPVRDARNVLKGNFYTIFSVDDLQETLMGSIDSIAADYRLVLVNPGGKIYDGSQQLLTILFQDNQHEDAMGELRYAFGSQHVPIVVPSKKKRASNGSTILVGLCFGLLFTILVYLLLQYLLPWIQYKVFCKKYVVKYKKNRHGSSEEQRCYHCKEPFEDGDDIVTKCEHVVHWECWIENRNRCPEYGVHNCTKGIHYYNQDKLSDPRNAPYFLTWLVYGLLAGLVSWVFMRLLYSETLFSSLINSLVQWLHPTDNLQESSSISFLYKIQSMLLCGILLGFFITLFFSCVIEFRKKSVKVLGLILLRSLVGGVLGFIAFLLGAFVIIFLNKDSNCFYTDWIPWALFAVGIAFTLSFKTDIKLKNALIGGLISVLISFVVLYMGTFAKELLSMFSYMLYAAGFGIAIAVVHHVSEKYFLRVSGPVKERDIAIYKWMSVTGGFNRVTIGKSIDCILEMNWDDAVNIADKQVEIYLENDRPYCKALADGTLLSNGQMLQKDQAILLHHGTEFTIGNTLFTYIEKDR